ncbi:hypothetical protein MycrhDRAFT_5773 [Mycolicibacterium rhodesiae JS60]|nr:hypothetical protein MycrhDRAFT_5773 [Mycolicibacterium rhodesiae JS60]
MSYTTPQSAADIVNRFTFHPATVEKGNAHQNVRTEIGSAAMFLDQNLPNGREKALAITKLEEAMFWANAAIARTKTESS